MGDTGKVPRDGAGAEGGRERGETGIDRREVWKDGGRDGGGRDGGGGEERTRTLKLYFPRIVV